MSAGGKSNAFLRWQSATVDAIVDDRTLEWKEKLLLLVLVRHANAFGTSYPSRETIVAETGLTWGPVRAAIRSAIAKRWLVKTPRCTPELGWETNLFRVQVPAAAARGGDGFVVTHGSVPSMDATNPQNKKGSGSLDPLSSQLLPKPPQGGAGGEGKKEREKQTPERAEAVHIVTACPDEQRRVRSARWAGNQFHKLEQALLAKSLSSGLEVRAAQQYAAGEGPPNLEKFIAQIADDVAGWSARLERRAKPLKSGNHGTKAPGRDATVQIPVMSPADVVRASQVAARLGVIDEPKLDSRRRLAAGTGISARGSR